MASLPFTLCPSNPQPPIFSHSLMWGDPHLVPLVSHLSRQACGMVVGRAGKHQSEDLLHSHQAGLLLAVLKSISVSFSP